MSPCSRLTSLLWISGIFACFTLSVSPCLPPPPPPPLFSFFPFLHHHRTLPSKINPLLTLRPAGRCVLFTISPPTQRVGRWTGGGVRPLLLCASLSGALLYLNLSHPPFSHACMLLPHISAWPFSSCCMCQNSGCFVVCRHL